MAKPIEPTPILEGKDAELFLVDLDSNNVHDSEKEEHLKSCCRLFNAIPLRE